jgi:hypothetical protein
MGFNAVGSVVAGKQAKTAGQAEAAVLNANADLAERQAAYALADEMRESVGFYGRGTDVLQKQRLQEVVSGLSTESGLFGDLYRETEYLSELDAEIARRNARFHFESSMAGAGILRKQAQAAGKSGQAAYQTSLVSAGGSLATGGLKAYGSF